MNSFMCLLLIPTVTIAGLSINRSFRWKAEFKDVISLYHVVSTGKGFSRIECATKCALNDACVSFFHDNASGGCQLHDYDFPSAPHVSFVHSPGNIYYRNEASCRWKGNYVYNIDGGTYVDFKMSDVTRSKDEADRICKKENGRLLVIQSADQLHSIAREAKSRLGNDTTGFWLGAKVNVTVGKFMWSDGRILERNSSLWNPSGIQYDPGTSPFVQCLVIFPYLGDLLDDFLCNTTLDMYPLCECYQHG